MLIESPIPAERRRQTIIITSGVRRLPDLVNVNAMIEPAGLLPDDTARGRGDDDGHDDEIADAAKAA